MRASGGRRRRRTFVPRARLDAARASGRKWRAAGASLRAELDSLRASVEAEEVSAWTWKAEAPHSKEDAELLEVSALRAEVADLRQRLASEASRWHHLRVSSPLTETHFWEELQPSADRERWRWCSSWCPCCKRPLDVSVFSAGEEELRRWRREEQGPSADTVPASTWDWATERRQHWAHLKAADLGGEDGKKEKPRFAYAASLWGAGPGFVLGALVLGQSLRRSGTRHDMVLMHTEDVPQSALDLLGQVWLLRRVEFIDAASDLFTFKGTRFDGVFTKLHALGLVEYRKVLMMDIDLAVLACPDELFWLPAPAALCRGVTGAEHGSRINGRNFFAGEILEKEDAAYEWGQHGGINAGLMLLAPNAALHARALREVRAPLHPERIPGNGPEQDYLSRLFAPWWTHIGVAFNYQLHHVFFALEAAVTHLTGVNAGGRGQAEDEEKQQPLCPPSGEEGHRQDRARAPEPWLPTRLALESEDVRIVHFSGELKMWDRDPFGVESDEEFADRLLRSNSPYSARLWLDRQGYDYEYAAYGVRLVGGSWEPLDAAGPPVAAVVELGVTRARQAARSAAKRWRLDLEAMPAAFPRLPPLRDLVWQLTEPSWPASAAYPRGARVEVWWRSTGQWYVATVTAAREDGALSVVFDEPGFWGTGARAVRDDCLRPLT